MTRNGVPIETHGIRHKVSTGIEFGSELYPVWEAVVESGGTLEELYTVWKGGHYTGRFLGAVVAFNQIRKAISMHSSDAQTTAAEKEAKRRR